MIGLSTFLLVGAGVGVAALTLQRLAVTRHLRGHDSYSPDAARAVTIAILKPLCGVDDGLGESLKAWVKALGPHDRMLLGVRDTSDPAWPLASRCALANSAQVSVHLQRGEPGLNPKVNQLCTLALAANGVGATVLLVSDSNTRPSKGLLEELRGLFTDSTLACVTNPVSGAGQATVGSLLDNLHLASAIGPGQIGAKVIADKNLVVGKSMALRTSVLAELGGFEAFKDVLAEDYVIGTALAQRKMKVAVARRPIFNVTVHRDLNGFIKRYLRWSVIHRTAVSFPTYLCQGLLNPWPLTLLAVALDPTGWGVLFSLLLVVGKSLLDASTARAMGMEIGWGAATMVPLKDLILFITWSNGLFQRTVDWRGNKLKVLPGSRLVAPTPAVVKPLALPDLSHLSAESELLSRSAAESLLPSRQMAHEAAR